MRGFPKHFNTKQDVLNVIKSYPEQTKAFLKRCIDERMAWITIGKISDGKAELTDKTHRIAELADDKSGVIVERYQEEFAENTTCKLFSLGFSVHEAQQIIDDK